MKDYQSDIDAIIHLIQKGIKHANYHANLRPTIYKEYTYEVLLEAIFLLKHLKGTLK